LFHRNAFPAAGQQRNDHRDVARIRRQIHGAALGRILGSIPRAVSKQFMDYMSVTGLHAHALYSALLPCVSVARTLALQRGHAECSTTAMHATAAITSVKARSNLPQARKTPAPYSCWIPGLPASRCVTMPRRHRAASCRKRG
jgi:hypothetical protein